MPFLFFNQPVLLFTLFCTVVKCVNHFVLMEQKWESKCESKRETYDQNGSASYNFFISFIDCQHMFTLVLVTLFITKLCRFVVISGKNDVKKTGSLLLSVQNL